MWYPPFNTGAGYAMGILAGAEMSFSQEAVSLLENWIDEMQTTLPELRAFILPGGSEVTSLCHVCRCVCRRLERSMVLWCEESGESLEETVWQYVNRLSDYCFVLARFLTKKLEINELIWEK